MNDVTNKADLVFDFLISHGELIAKRRIIKNIKNILFDGFNVDWKAKNQKFDFSFSFGECDEGALRFSYNNFGEKKEFYEKVMKIFDLFKDVYAIDTVKCILDRLRSREAVFQTTIGFEWVCNADFPRFKIYFDEIHQKLSKTDRIKMVKKTAELINIDYEKLGMEEGDNIGMICVDFLPKKEIQLKVYFIAVGIDFSYLERVFDNAKYMVDLAKEFTAIFSVEQKSFYYMARRFSGGGLSSIKMYKIYEVGGITDFSRSYEEIFQFLKHSTMKKNTKKIKSLFSFALENKILFYPVTASLDLSINGNVKFDLYLSIQG